MWPRETRSLQSYIKVSNLAAPKHRITYPGSECKFEIVRSESLIRQACIDALIEQLLVPIEVLCDPKP